MKKELSSRWREKLLFLSTSKATITSAENQENERRVIKPHFVILILFRVCKPRYGVGWSFDISSLHTSEVRLKTVSS